MKLGRWLVLAGSVILAATAVFHATGYATVASGIDASGARPLIVSAVKALWIMFTIHLIFISVLLFLASRTPAAGHLVLVAACVPACDTLVLLRFVGVFIGTLALALATILIAAGGFLVVRHTPP